MIQIVKVGTSLKISVELFAGIKSEIEITKDNLDTAKDFILDYIKDNPDIKQSVMDLMGGGNHS